MMPKLDPVVVRKMSDWPHQEEDYGDVYPCPSCQPHVRTPEIFCLRPWMTFCPKCGVKITWEGHD